MFVPLPLNFDPDYLFSDPAHSDNASRRDSIGSTSMSGTMRRMSLRRSSSPPPSPFAVDSKSNPDLSIDRLSQTHPGSNSRVRCLRDLFYKSRYNAEACKELANDNVIEDVLLKEINSNEHETERNWAAGILENITNMTEEGREKCFGHDGVRILMKRIFMEKNNTETKRSCIAALSYTIMDSKEAKAMSVKYGSVKMFMDLLENYDSSTGADIVLAVSGLVQHLDNSVAEEVAERGGCDQFIKRIESNHYRNDRVYSLRALSNLLEKVEKSREEAMDKNIQAKLIELLQNEFEDKDEIKLHAGHCLFVLAQHNDDIKKLCKDSYLLIFLDPLQENPNYHGPDREEKAGQIRKFVELLGGQGKELKKSEPAQKMSTSRPPPRERLSSSKSSTHEEPVLEDRENAE